MRKAEALIRQIGYGLLSSYQDYRALYTWRSWLFGWLARLLCQVLFFSMVGWAIGSAATQRYMALGNAVVLGPSAPSEWSPPVSANAWRHLAVSPAQPQRTVPRAAGARLYWVADGIVTSCIALFVLRWLADVEVSPPMLLVCFLLQVLITLSGYSLALALAGISLRWPESRMYLTAGTTILLMTLAGVNTPLPRGGVVGAIAAVMPAAHGLQAIRALVAHGTVPAGEVFAEFAVLLLWGAVGYLALTGSLRHQVRTGTLNLR